MALRVVSVDLGVFGVGAGEGGRSKEVRVAKAERGTWRSPGNTVAAEMGENRRPGWRVPGGGGGTPLFSEEAPHFIINCKSSAKTLKEVLSAAAGVISFIRIRALNHQILWRNGTTFQRNSPTLQRPLGAYAETAGSFLLLLLQEKEGPLLKQFVKLGHVLA